MTRSTLAAIDFSPGSLSALALAHRLTAREPGATIHAVHALAIPDFGGSFGAARFGLDAAALRADLERELVTLIAAHVGPTPVETHVVVGAPATALVDEARRLGCERIVIGASGMAALPRRLLGSVTDRVMRTSPIDVVVVPPAEPHPALLRDVVCGCDFSVSSETALVRALDLATTHDARLHLVHAWDVAPYAERLTDLVRSVEEDRARRLTETAHRHERAGTPILRHLRRGGTAEQILAVVEATDAGLVVVGHGDQSELDRFLIGSVAERVVRGARVPVVLARTRRPS